MKKSAALSVGLVFDDSLDSSDGVSQYVKTLGAWLTGQGHNVTYIVGQSQLESWAGASVVSASKNIRLRWGGNRLSMPIWPKTKTLKRLLNTQDFDVLHIQVPYSPLMAQYLIRRSDESTAVIGTFHVFPAKLRAVFGAWLLRLIYGRSLGRFDQIVAVSRAAASFARSGFGLECEISPNLVDLAKFKTKKRLSNQKTRVVFLGRLVERKGCRQLIEAFARLRKELADIELIIAGDGPLRNKLENYVAQHDLTESVTFLGFISEADKPALLKSADVACFPSLYGESFGIVLIEAMAAGAGVVLGGDNPGYRTVLGEKPRLLVDPKDTEQFAARLKLLLSDQTEIEELHRWQENTLKQYDVEHVGRQLVDIYHQQIARRTKKSNN